MSHQTIARRDPNYPWFVGFHALTLEELATIRVDLLEELDMMVDYGVEPERREGMVQWVEEIHDEVARRADRMLLNASEEAKGE